MCIDATRVVSYRRRSRNKSPAAQPPLPPVDRFAPSARGSHKYHKNTRILITFDFPVYSDMSNNTYTRVRYTLWGTRGDNNNNNNIIITISYWTHYLHYTYIYNIYVCLHVYIYTDIIIYYCPANEMV